MKVECGFCRKLIEMNEEHQCEPLFIDKETKPARLRKAVATVMISWAE